MSYTITTSENGKYSICRVTGEITVDVARQFYKELNRLSRALNIKRFLNDVRDASNALSTLENYDFAYKDMSELKLQRNVCAAIRVGPGDRTHDFVETVTQNAGYNVRVFRDEEAESHGLTMMNVGRGSSPLNSANKLWWENWTQKRLSVNDMSVRGRNKQNPNVAEMNITAC